MALEVSRTMTLDGFLNLDKPTGWTSHDCVARLRRLLQTRRIGHGGTLDPAVTGVLPIAIGRATRLLQYLPEGKAYEGTIRFGVVTDTDDLEGDVLAEADASGVTREAIAALLPRFSGSIRQLPPRVSAVRVDGKRLYQRARAGEVFEVPERAVTIDRIEIRDWRPGAAAELDLRVVCSPGTYIRSLARDLGAALGCGGTLARLRRTASSGFTLAGCLTLEQVEARVAAGELRLQPAAIALAHLPVLSLDADQVPRWLNGQKLPWDGEDVPYRVVADGHDFLGVGRVVEGLLRPQLVWHPEEAVG